MEECQKVVIKNRGEVLLVRPRLSKADAVALADNLFGLEATNPQEVSELNSYQDRNFYIKGRLKQRGRETDGTYSEYSEFLLKINNSGESRNTQFFEICEDLISLCSQQNIGVRFPTVIQPLTRKTLVMAEIPLEVGFAVEGGSLDDPGVADTLKDILRVSEDDASVDVGTRFLVRHIVRLFVYIPGTVLSAEQVTGELARDIGKVVAHIRLAWQGYPYYPAMERPQYRWNLSKFHNIYSPWIEGNKDAQTRELVHGIVDRFRSIVLPQLDGLAKGYAHCDVNEQNIIVDVAEGDRVKLSGLVDFGDMNYSYPVMDLAIAMTYLGVLKPTQFARVTGDCLKGYNSVFPVSDAEFNVLFDLLVTRLAQSLTIGEYTYYVLDPGNEYVLVTARCVRDILRTIGEVGRENIVAEWRTCIKN